MWLMCRAVSDYPFGERTANSSNNCNMCRNPTRHMYSPAQAIQDRAYDVEPQCCEPHLGSSHLSRYEQSLGPCILKLYPTSIQ